MSLNYGAAALIFRPGLPAHPGITGKTAAGVGPARRIRRGFLECRDMEKLAKVGLAAAPACPNCRQRVTDLNLDELASGAEHQCLFCGNFMRVPKAILDRLIEQRDAARAANIPQGSLITRVMAFFRRLLGG